MGLQAVLGFWQCWVVLVLLGGYWEAPGSPGGGYWDDTGMMEMAWRKKARPPSLLVCEGCQTLHCLRLFFV